MNDIGSSEIEHNPSQKVHLHSRDSCRYWTQVQPFVNSTVPGSFGDVKVTFSEPQWQTTWFVTFRYFSSGGHLTYFLNSSVK